jgi:hypothetical protein
MSETYILKWPIETESFAVRYTRQGEAFQKAGELFDEHGPNRVTP